MGDIEIRSVGAQLKWPSRFKNTHSDLMRFQSFFHPLGSNQKGVECLAIRWSGADGGKEVLALPAVYTHIFPLSGVGSMLMQPFLLTRGATRRARGGKGTAGRSAARFREDREGHQEVSGYTFVRPQGLWYMTVCPWDSRFSLSSGWMSGGCSA